MKQKIETVWEGWFHEPLPKQAWIDVVGSGGKTSLIRWLATGFAAVGRRVVITTSTHIYPIPDLWQESLTAVERKLIPGEIIQLGTLMTKGKSAGKLTAPSQEQWQRLSELADIILVEADGSRRLPLKFPAVHEPVLSTKSTHTLIVQGLSALGQDFDLVCQRSELARQALPSVFDRQQMTVELPLMAMLLREGYRRIFSGRRCGICLNQADMLPSEEKLSVYRQALQSPGLPVQALQLTAHPQEKIGLILMASGFSRRFGKNKLLYEVAGRPLIDHALELTAAVRHQLWSEGLACSICVVSRQSVIREKAEKLRMTAIDNPNSEEGISATIRLGTTYMLEQGASRFVYLVADQPELTAKTVVWLIRQAIASPLGMTVPAAGARLGNPCIFSGLYADLLLGLQGEQGGKLIIREHMNDCQTVAVEERELFDIDKKEQIDTIF